MSFRCDRCGEVQPVRSKPHKVVTETRERIYPEVVDEEDPSIVICPEGHGWEVVKEIEVCERCASDRD